jgi:hypothetical protein
MAEPTQTLAELLSAQGAGSGLTEQPITMREFLERQPPSRMVGITDLWRRVRSTGGGWNDRLTAPELQLHCDNDNCKGLRYFRCTDDPFGYIDQLGFYLDGANDRLVDKDVGSFLAIDKTLGHVTLDTYAKPNKDYSIVVEQKKEMLAQPEPPERAFQDQPFQKSGNKKLGVACSYCPFKFKCWPGLRVFQYANKPVFLTHVAREPKVSEVTNNQETEAA